MNDYLQTIDADTLLNTLMPPSQFVVDQLLPAGLHILAGAPKTGKSWLALWLCLRVAQGEPLWTFPTRRSTVLYLCLEDSYTRIQKRLFQLTEDAPDTLYFSNLSGGIGSGLEEQLRAFLAEHPDTSLVVIDTLQKVRYPESDGNAYAGDYRDISVLKQLADGCDIAVLLVHHLRKMKDDDPMNMISGTTGISGAADSSFVLKPDRRGSNFAMLYCTGRDIEYRELELRFEKGVWYLESDSADTPELPDDPTLMLLSDFLFQLGHFEGTATELSNLLEERTGETMLPSVLSKKLVRYTGELDARGICFSTSRTRDARLLHILCRGDGSDGNDGKIGIAPYGEIAVTAVTPVTPARSPL